MLTVIATSNILSLNLNSALIYVIFHLANYFTCSCGVRFIGRATMHLHKRIKEHHPVGLTEETISTIRSSILKILMDSNHIINNEKEFKILYRTSVNQYLYTKLKYLNMAEAILINSYKPELCSQKKLLHKVLLLWRILFRWILFYFIVYLI